MADKSDKGAKPAKSDKAPPPKGGKAAPAPDAKGAKTRKEDGAVAAAGAVKAAPKDYVARLKKL